MHVYLDCIRNVEELAMLRICPAMDGMPYAFFKSVGEKGPRRLIGGAQSSTMECLEHAGDSSWVVIRCPCLLPKSRTTSCIVLPRAAIEGLLTTILHVSSQSGNGFLGSNIDNDVSARNAWYLSIPSEEGHGTS